MIAKARLLVAQSGLLVMQMLVAHQYGNAHGRRNIQKDLRQIRIARLYLDEQKDTEKCHQRHKGENRTKINGIFLAAQTGTGAQKRETHSKEKYNAIQMYRVLGAIDKAERESQTGRDPKILDFCQHQRQQCVRRTENAVVYHLLFGFQCLREHIRRRIHLMVFAECLHVCDRIHTAGLVIEAENKFPLLPIVCQAVLIDAAAHNIDCGSDDNAEQHLPIAAQRTAHNQNKKCGAE